MHSAQPMRVLSVCIPHMRSKVKICSRIATLELLESQCVCWGVRYCTCQFWGLNLGPSSIKKCCENKACFPMKQHGLQLWSMSCKDCAQCGTVSCVRSYSEHFKSHLWCDSSELIHLRLQLHTVGAVHCTYRCIRLLWVFALIWYRYGAVRLESKGCSTNSSSRDPYTAWTHNPGSIRL